MVAPLHIFNTILVGRSLQQEGKMFMAKPLVYAVGAAVAAGLAWMIFGGEGEAQAAPPACAGVDGLREPLRSQVKAALADPAMTADKLETLAKAIDVLTPPYACPAAAAEVRQAAKTKVIGPVSPVTPYVPPNVHPPAGPTVGCAPTTPQTITLPTAGTPEQIADGITAGEGTDQELLTANPNGGPGWTFTYQVDAYVGDPSLGNKTTTYQKYEHYMHPSSVPAPPGSQVTWISTMVAAGTDLHLPLSWNTFMRFTGSYYSGGVPVFEVERGVHHPACVGA